MATTAIEKRPQPHGGALNAGGTPGNRGGFGLPSALRRALRESGARRIQVLEEIADGVPVKQVDVPLAAVLKHATCPKCGDALQATGTPEDAVFVSLQGVESASPSDRRGAIDTLLKHGLGPTATVEDVRERLRMTVEILREELGKRPQLCERVLNRVGHVWRTGE